MRNATGASWLTLPASSSSKPTRKCRSKIYRRPTPADIQATAIYNRAIASDNWATDIDAQAIAADRLTIATDGRAIGIYIQTIGNYIQTIAANIQAMPANIGEIRGCGRAIAARSRAGPETLDFDNFRLIYP